MKNEARPRPTSSFKPDESNHTGLTSMYIATMPATKTIPLEQFFSALADRTRLRLLNLMRDGEVCVCFFVEILGASQPKISRHLAYLRRAGMVVARREGKWMHYRIGTPSDPTAARILADLIAALGDDPEMRRDRERLVDVCCSPKLPALLEGAPLPASIARDRAGAAGSCC